MAEGQCVLQVAQESDCDSIRNKINIGADEFDYFYETN